jgi:hypothetical protein
VEPQDFYFNEEPSLKIVYMAIHEASKKWTIGHVLCADPKEVAINDPEKGTRSRIVTL